jgi:aldehyde dehydrogenase
MRYIDPNQPGSKVHFKAQYENFIGGQWIAPIKGEYFDNLSPVDGKVFTRVPRSSVEDIELALDAAHKAKVQWNKSSPTTRSNILLKIADRLEANLEQLAVAETWDNGKPIRETLAADIPLAIDHFRYFAGCIRAQEGGISEIDEDTIAYHFHEPLGVVGQIIPWNFPILMAAWKLAPALAASNCDKHRNCYILKNHQDKKANRSPLFALFLEETSRFGRVADQQVFGLLIMIQHHLVVFTTNA